MNTDEIMNLLALRHTLTSQDSETFKPEIEHLDTVIKELIADITIIKDNENE